MFDRNMIPETYEQWRYCIETLGEVRLTSAYLHKRLAIFENEGHTESKQFAKLYGKTHLQRTASWFRRAIRELP